MPGLSVPLAVLASFLPESGRHAFTVSSPQLVLCLVSGLATVICVLLHYEALSIMSRRLPAIRLRRRARVVVAILGIMLTHVVQVWIFGLTYWLLDHFPTLGRLPGEFDEGALDFVYFSVVTYTTLGFGDIVPVGAIRILAGTEALLGLTLITWSASFTFLEMQRDWGEFRQRPQR